MDRTRKLRVLIADGTAGRLEEVTRTVISLGHEVVGEGVSLDTVGRATAAELPDVALVIVGEIGQGPGSDPHDRARGRVPGDRDPRRAGSGVHGPGGPARHLLLHHTRR